MAFREAARGGCLLTYPLFLLSLDPYCDVLKLFTDKSGAHGDLAFNREGEAH